jgi:hypothetical protein
MYTSLKLLTLIFISAVIIEDSFAADSNCPGLKVEDLKRLKGEHILESGGHKWYLNGMFYLPDTLGNHIPLDLTIEDVMNVKDITFATQLDQHTCQFKASVANDHKITMTFKLMGE